MPQDGVTGDSQVVNPTLGSALVRRCGPCRALGFDGCLRRLLTSN
jgi:hypothetical protein